jgi:hypothetical protein
MRIQTMFPPMALDLEGIDVAMANFVRLLAFGSLVLGIGFFQVAKLCHDRRPGWLADMLTGTAVILFVIAFILFSGSFM